MRHPKQIKRPDLTRCEKLTPLQANGIHFGNMRTVISPEMLAESGAQDNESE